MSEFPLYLNGQWVTGVGSIETTNPATGEPVTRVTTADARMARQAIADAGAALDAWRGSTALSRADYLIAAARELDRRADEVARAITLENGKPLAQSRGEVSMSVDHLRWFAEEGCRAYGRIIPSQVAGKHNLVVKRPIGVVGAISPWNFPLVLAVRKIAPALAAGCPVVLKPASQTPLCALLLAECFDAVRLPAAVLQVLVGSAAMIAGHFLTNPICRKITFTGSTSVGQRLIAGAAEQVKPLSLELGGCAPAIVFDDADLDQAVDAMLVAKFRNSGQSCIAANRIYVQSGIYDRFVDAFVARTRKLRVGDGLQPQTDVGPVINQEGLETAIAHVQDARSRGARVLCGGTRVGDRGLFFAPTVLADVPPEAACMNDETFAPIAPFACFECEEDAIARANASPFGLAAYAFTRDLGRMFRLAERIEVGTLGINDGAPTTSNAPFGGSKLSGWGRELGSEGIDAFLETRHVSVGLSS